MYEPLETVRTVGGGRIHRFQVVQEHRGGGAADAWIVVGFTDGGVQLADVDFEWTREVAAEEFADGRFEPLVAGGVPVWGY